jgi:hypothetical protein
MIKQFTKVTKTYATKNKLQLLILTTMQDIDCTLFDNKGEATNYIFQLYNNALLAYKGNAAIPELKTFDGAKNVMQFYVEDVLWVSMYNVQNDLS